MSARPATKADLLSVLCPAGGPAVLDPFDPEQTTWLKSDDESAHLFAGGMRLFCASCGCGLWAFGFDHAFAVIAAHYRPPAEAAD